VKTGDLDSSISPPIHRVSVSIVDLSVSNVELLDVRQTSVLVINVNGASKKRTEAATDHDRIDGIARRALKITIMIGLGCWGYLTRICVRELLL
jgi:hypothetical protein